ncbi:hypothetical protein AeMF1_009787 [Aphanomyces euteiches]|nr:hypothetical protein AeMF1_009787 [Aphanomyces euteiches]KAH9195146.1 hypothetical protein AeNC1_002884 [Aphanomyces euteiches]
MERSKRPSETPSHGPKKAKSTPDPYENTLVAFYREEEEWLSGSVYDGAELLVGLVLRKMIAHRYVYLIQWIPLPVDALRDFDPSNSIHANENLSNYVHLNPEADILTLAQGREMFYSLNIQADPQLVTRSSISPETQDWHHEIPWDLENDEAYWTHRHMQVHVEQMNLLKQAALPLRNLSHPLNPPTKLFEHPPSFLGTPSDPNKMFVKPTDRHLFEHSAVSSFLAYLPLTFWNDVVQATNTYGISAEHITPSTSFVLDEVMTYLGVLLHINLVHKYESLHDYWTHDQGNTSDMSLESVLPYARFNLLHTCFRVSKFRDPTDPLTSIRPLIQVLQRNCSKYIVPGRDVFVSSLGERHIVVDNKQVQLIFASCPDTGLMANFKVYVSPQAPSSANIVQNVVEVVHPLCYSHRIIHVHSPFVSHALAQQLLAHGMYYRGSTPLPTCTFANEPSSLLASQEQPVQWAATAIDGLAAVTTWKDNRVALGLLTNVDCCYPDFPASIAENLQAHKRFQRLQQWCSFHLEFLPVISWAHRLVLDLMDIARVNGYLARQLVRQDEESMWAFSAELSKELLRGDWKYAPPDGVPKPVVVDVAPPPVASPPRCVPRRSKEVFSQKKQDKDSRCKSRQCVVCRWESLTKSVTEVTDYCDVHDVCLCSCVRQNYVPAPYMCPNTDWTCWEKFHNFYMPQKLFIKGARVQRRNWLYKLRHSKSKSKFSAASYESNSHDDDTSEPGSPKRKSVPLAPKPDAPPFPPLMMAQAIGHVTPQAEAGPASSFASGRGQSRGPPRILPRADEVLTSPRTSNGKFVNV